MPPIAKQRDLCGIRVHANPVAAALRDRNIGKQRIFLIPFFHSDTGTNGIKEQLEILGKGQILIPNQISLAAFPSLQRALNSLGERQE